MDNQLPIFQEIDNYLQGKRLSEIFEKAASILSPKYDVIAIKAITPVVFMLLKRGIQYVHDTYGIVASHFIIDGDTSIQPQFEDYDPPLICYQPERDSIVINYRSLGIMGDGVINRERYMSIGPIEHWGKHYCISVRDGIFLAGIEEAHHAYYIKSGESYRRYQTPEEYKNDPLELAAGKVVRQAIQKQGIQLYMLTNGHYVPCNYPEGDTL